MPETYPLLAVDRVSIMDKMKSLGHTVFEKGNHNLNVVFLRNMPPTYDAKGRLLFRDIATCFYLNHGYWNFHAWRCTTIPGTEWLESPMRPSGCAIRLPGQVRNSHDLGMHHGKPAMVQIADIPIERDANKDRILHFGENRQVATPSSGLNLHRAGEASEIIGAWSAGCFVWAVSADFLEFLALVERQKAAGFGTRITTTLLERQRLPEDA